MMFFRKSHLRHLDGGHLGLGCLPAAARPPRRTAAQIRRSAAALGGPGEANAFSDLRPENAGLLQESTLVARRASNNPGHGENACAIG